MNQTTEMFLRNIVEEDDKSIADLAETAERAEQHLRSLKATLLKVQERRFRIFTDLPDNRPDTEKTYPERATELIRAEFPDLDFTLIPSRTTCTVRFYRDGKQVNACIWEMGGIPLEGVVPLIRQNTAVQEE